MRLTVGGPGTHFVGDFNRDPRIMGRQYEANARANLLASKGFLKVISNPLFEVRAWVFLKRTEGRSARLQAEPRSS